MCESAILEFEACVGEEAAAFRIRIPASGIPRYWNYKLMFVRDFSPARPKDLKG